MAKKIRARKAESKAEVPTTLIGGAGEHSRRWIVLIVLAAIVLVVGGYFAYQYISSVQQQINGEKLREENNRKAQATFVETRLKELEANKPAASEPGYVLVAYYSEYADMLNQSGKSDQALAALKAAEAIPSTNYSSYLLELLARQYQKRGDSSKAKEYWQKAFNAVDKDPSVADEIKNDVKQSYQDELK